ncbi:MAG: acetyltransferase [Abditibacteriota bacterium]|nr:acetyltransferase [Abditibacteriota bacterium]
MKLLIYGAGGLGREYCDIATRINNIESKWTEIAFIDDNKQENEYYNHPVYTFDEISSFDRKDTEFVVGVGNPATRELLFNKMKEGGFTGAVLLDPQASISPSATFKEGAVVSAFVLISSLSTLCENSLVLPGAVIGHDVTVGKHSFVCCNCSIGGNVKIGERVFFAENVPCKEGLTIGDDSVMSLGAVILRDVPESVIMFGNPARAMRNNDEKKVF